MTPRLTTLIASLLLGCAAQPSIPKLKTVAGDCSRAWAEWGTPLSTTPDQNADGVAEVLLSVASTEGHRVELRSGLDGTLLWERPAAQRPAMALLEDLDGDGVPELLLTSAVDPIQEDCGDNCGSSLHAWTEYRLELLETATGAVRWTRAPEPTRPELNSRFTVVHDEDGDGVRDLLVSAPYSHATEPSPLQLVSGASGAPLRALTIPERSAESLGHTVIALADQNGDGRPELLVTDPRGPYDDYALGRVVLLSSVDEAILWERSGRGIPGALLYGEGIGTLSSEAGLELLIGAHNGGAESDLDAEAGALEVVDARTGARRLLLTGRRGAEHFGISASDVGDLNGDGRSDFAVGSPMPGLPIIVMGEGGRISIHSGLDGSTLVDIEEEIAANERSRQFGMRVFGLGDRRIAVQGNAASPVTLSLQCAAD